MRGAIPHRQANCALVDVTSVSVAWPIVTGIPMIAVRKRRTASDLFDFLFIFIFFFRSFRDPTALRSSVFIPVLSLVKRRVCAREDFLNLFHAFCLHMKMAVFIFLPILRKKRNLITFNNFPRDKMKGGHVIFFTSRVEESGFH